MPRISDRVGSSSIRGGEDVNDLYPSIEPYRTGRLAVDDIHTLYWEECGNPNGTPVLFLHGGPGAGCSPEHRRLFHPHYYPTALFRQRGAPPPAPPGSARHKHAAHPPRGIRTT